MDTPGMAARLRPVALYAALLLSVCALCTGAFPPAGAVSVAELSSSNGATTCPMYFTGPGVALTVWNASSSTCTVTAQPDVGPTVCISDSPGGCTGNATDDLVIESGVTVVLQGSGGSQNADMCVYSTLENYGTIVGGSFCDYGTIVNHGTIEIPRGNYFMTLPYNGFGILDNLQGGQVINDYNFIDAGIVVNNGTFYNHGQFSNDNQYDGTFTNHGSFIGSAPCFSFEGCRTWLGLYNVTSGTVINQLGNGIMLTITGASGTNVAVFSQNQTSAAPLGLGSLNISSALFYDVMVNGLSTGNARLCIANSHVTQSMAGGMQYWSGAEWAFASNQTVTELSQTHPLNGTSSTATSSVLMLCGDVPVADLAGTPIGAGTPLSTPPGATTTPANSKQDTTPSHTSTGTFPANGQGDSSARLGGADANDWLYAAVGAAVVLIVAAFGTMRWRKRAGVPVREVDQAQQHGSDSTS